MRKSDIEKVLNSLIQMEELLKKDKTSHGTRKLESLKTGITSLKNLLSYVMVVDGAVTLITPIRKGDKIGWMVEINNGTIRNF